MAPGTLAGGLQAIAPLFKPLDDALRSKLRTEPYWHADETRWAVFVDVLGKVGHRWYMWVFQSCSVVHYVVDESRAAEVVMTELAGVKHGIISCDRYSGYKRFARLNPGVKLAFCWAHQRRDFLDLANSYPESAEWALQWVDTLIRFKGSSTKPACSAGECDRQAADTGFKRKLKAVHNHKLSKLKNTKISFSRYYKNQISMVQIVDFIGDWGGGGA